MEEGVGDGGGRWGKGYAVGTVCNKKNEIERRDRAT